MEHLKVLLNIARTRFASNGCFFFWKEMGGENLEASTILFIINDYFKWKKYFVLLLYKHIFIQRTICIIIWFYYFTIGEGNIYVICLQT